MKSLAIFAAFIVIFISDVSSLYLETNHTGLWMLADDILHNLTLSLKYNISHEFPRGSEAILKDPEALLVVTVIPDEDWKLDFVNSSVVFTSEEVSEGAVKNITFSGYYWGLTQLSFYLTRNDLDPEFDDDVLLRDDLEIVINRQFMTLDTVFISIGAVFILFNNINMGAQLNLKIIGDVLKKPLGPLCGFLSQFIFMPTITWTMGKLLFTDPLTRLGLFTYGCSPGGSSSNFWTLMFNGDINLSITMTAVSTVAAMGMMPLWMFTLGSSLLEENNNLQIPFSNLAITLVALTIPASIGVFIRLKKPTWAERGRKIIKPFSLFILIFFITIGTINSYKVVLMMTWRMFTAGALVMLCGYTLGAIFARIMCLTKPQIIAVSIETALQNSSVGFILLKLSIGSPYSDMASLPIMATMFVSGPPLILVYFSYLFAKRFCGCCQDDNTGDEDVEDNKNSPGEAKEDPEATITFLPEDKDDKSNEISVQEKESSANS